MTGLIHLTVRPAYQAIMSAGPFLMRTRSSVMGYEEAWRMTIRWMNRAEVGFVTKTRVG